MGSQVKFPEAEARKAFKPDGTPLETFWQKGFRKCTEQPLVPLGTIATAGALLTAAYHLRKGNRAQFQSALRWRVALQGVTVVGAVLGTMYVGGGAKAAVPGSSPDVKDVTTAPGRPLTNAQAARAQEERQADRAQLQERLREMELREEQAQKLRAEQALLAPSGDGYRSRPIIGRDARARSQGGAGLAAQQQQQQYQAESTEKLV